MVLITIILMGFINQQTSLGGTTLYIHISQIIPVNNVNYPRLMGVYNIHRINGLYPDYPSKLPVLPELGRFQVQ